MNGPGLSFAVFAERYVAVWNEPDAARRRRSIEALWAPDGANFTSGSEHRGYDALEARVRVAHHKWVRDGGCVFRQRNAAWHHGAVRVLWDMVSISSGEVISTGLEFLVLGADGRIQHDYQFIEPAA